MRYAVFLLALLIIAACERQAGDVVDPQETDASPSNRTPVERPASTSLEASDVIVSDELAGFDAPIGGIAFWTHPSLVFQGMMLVAVDGTIKAYNIEDGAIVSSLEAISAQGLALAYDGLGAEARGVGAVYDIAQEQFRFFTVDNASRKLLKLQSLMVTPKAMKGYCLGRRTDGTALALHVLTDAAVLSYDLSLTNLGVSVEQSSKRPSPAPLNVCAVDSLDGAVFAAAETGEIFRFAGDASPTAPFAATGVVKPGALEIIFNGLVEGGATDECCGQLALLDGASGAIHIIDRDDGHALGVVALTASYDVQAVRSASAMGLGASNFGGAYRNGVLAVATPSSERESASDVIRLAPWSGVLNALELPVSKTSAPRDLASGLNTKETAGEDALAIPALEIDPIKP